MGSASSQQIVEIHQPQTFQEFLADVAEANQMCVLQDFVFSLYTKPGHFRGEQFKNEKGETLRFIPNKEKDIKIQQFWRSFCQVQALKVCRLSS